MRNRKILLLVVAILAPPARVAAQAVVARATPTVLLVLASPSDAKANVEIVRSPSNSPQNIIIVGKGANGADIATALATLGGLRMHDGESVTREVRVVPKGRLASTTAAAERARSGDEQLAALRAGEFRKVAGFGQVQALELSLPSVSFKRSVADIPQTVRRQ